MILYQLQCTNGHGFDAWFRDSAAFDKQSKIGCITCPMCGDTGCTKAPMAPRISRRSQSAQEAERRAAYAMRALGEVRRAVEDSCEFVGERFPEEARRIHYGETRERGIYGEATDREARELADEGIEVRRIPWVLRRDA
jgi:hypothetical protein